MVAAAPPPPSQSEVASEINQQSQEADAAEKEMASEAPASGPIDSASAPPAAPAAPAAPANISVGQSIADVTGSLGQPSKIVNLGAKKIYIYPDMKITFLNGKVSNVE
jgi:hypothetical protein